MFTVSLKRSNSLFCLLINPRDCPSRRLLRWSHPWSSSRWRPRRERGCGLGAHLRPDFAFFNCDVRFSRRLTRKNQFPGSALLSEKRCVKTGPQAGSADKLEMLYQNLTRWTNESSLVSECISYIDLFMWIWKISTFSPDLAVTWGFCPNDFSLCPSECMLYECVTAKQSLYLYLKKKTAHGYQNPSKGLVQMN